MKVAISPAVLRQYAIVLVVNFSVFVTGMHLAWPSPVLVKLRNETETPLTHPITDEEGSWIVSLGFLIGILNGANEQVVHLMVNDHRRPWTFAIPTFAICSNITSTVPGGMLLEVIGRKYCILLASLPRLFMGFLLIFATEVWMLIFGRCVLMISDGLVFTVVPVYASEIASKEQRGALGTLLQIFSSLGIVCTLSVGPFTSYSTFNIIFTSVMIITTLPLFFLPDSPQFLYSKGRTQEAIEVLEVIRGPEAAKQEIEEYKSNTENKEKINKMAVLRNRTFLKSLLLSLTLGVGNHCIGFNAISFYLQTILESTQISVRPEIASVIMGVIQLLASCCSPPISSKFGRKTILMWSLTGYLLGMLGLGTFFKITEPKDYQITGFMNYLPIISLIIAIYCFCVGPGSLFWLIAAELFDGRSRAFGFSLSMVASTFMIFLTTKYFIFVTNTLGASGTYWLFSAVTVILLTLIVVFLPETKGKSFAEIQAKLKGGNNEFQDVNKKTDASKI